MNVEQGDFDTTVAPEDLHTTGLGPCIGAAVICNDRGFVMHAQHVLIEKETVTDRFFELLAQHIPEDKRRFIKPVLAGGSLEGDEANEDPDCSVAKCRSEIVRMFRDAGYGSPIVRWCEPHEIHSLHLDLTKGVVFLETNDLNADETKYEYFKMTSDTRGGAAA